jgi:hypothetical protein
MSNISKPNTFSSNTAISSSQVNANFDTIYNDYNGGISATNLATGAVTTAKIADANVTTAKIADDAVTPDKMDFGAQASAIGVTNGTTTSTSFVTTLTTSGALPTVTATVPASGTVMVIITVSCFSSTSESRCEVSYSLSGANTLTATTNATNGRSVVNRETSTTAGSTGTGIYLHTGLTAGSTTFQLEARVQSGTGNFINTQIAVIPIGD